MTVWQRLLESNEILATVVATTLALVGWLIKRLIAPRPKLIWAHAHLRSYLTKRTPDEERPTLLINTKDFLFANEGRSAIENIEITLNFVPSHFELWPPIRYETHRQNSGRETLQISRLGRKESFYICMLCVDQAVPDIVDVRCKNTEAKKIALEQIRLFSKPTKTIILVILASGILLWIYFTIIAIKRFIFGPL